MTHTNNNANDAADVGNSNHVVFVSWVVWERVVEPGWLGSGNRDLFCTAEAMFPMIGLVCPRVVAETGKYIAIRDAAEALAPSCVAWMLNKMPSQSPRVMMVKGCVGEEEEEEGGGGGGRSERKPHSNDVSGNLEAVRSMFGDDDDYCGGDGDSPSDSERRVEGRKTSSFPLLWDGRCVVVPWRKYCCRWLVGTGGAVGIDAVVKGLREDVRDYMMGSCGFLGFTKWAIGAGHVGVAKWLAPVLRITRENAPMRLRGSLSVALARGKMEVVEWMFHQFDLGNTLSTNRKLDMAQYCSLGETPANVKWCQANFSVHFGKRYFSLNMLSNKRCNMEVCQWLEDSLIAKGLTSKNTIGYVQNPDVARWLLSVVVDEPAEAIEKHLNELCKNTGDVNFGAPKRGSSLARWLYSNKFAPLLLSQEDLLKGLSKALLVGNIDVAKWLEDTFHVMDSSVNSSPIERAEKMLITLCRKGNGHKDRFSGFQWFIEHLAHPSEFSEKAIHLAIDCALAQERFSNVQLILCTFTQYHPQRDADHFKKITVELMGVSLELFLEFYESTCSSSNGGGSEAWTTDFVAQCLSSENLDGTRSKTVKWLVSKFGLQYSNIKLNSNSLLFKLLSWHIFWK
ncbi:hypothetical protein Pelo_4989 [Pelomyxa schiedti]|nr:hypothetical protein Pelo_4989 [Pelomyxa schiedti]